MGRPPKKDKETEKPVEEVKEEVKEEKPEEPVKESDEIMLATFKDIANIDNMTYAGFKASLNAKDEDKFKQSELEKKLEAFKTQSAFKI